MTDEVSVLQHAYQNSFESRHELKQLMAESSAEDRFRASVVASMASVAELAHKREALMVQLGELTNL